LIARRIVSLLPSATEILFAIGAGESVVGVTHECDFPPAARTRAVLTSSLLPRDAGTAGEIDRHVRASVHSGSSLYALDAQRLAQLDPGLIVTQELCAVCAVSYDIVERAAKRLRSDPRVISLEPSSLEDVYATIAVLGELTGRERGATEVVSALRAREAMLRNTPREAQPRTLILEWTDPPMSGGHWTPALVELAGGIPLLANPGANSQTLAWEAIAAADPDVVIVVPCGFDLAHARTAVEELGNNATWNALRAKRDGHAYVMDGNAYVNRPGPRLIDSAERFAWAFDDAQSPINLSPQPAGIARIDRQPTVERARQRNRR
jgi:iron complex transport system substrate-binding protein